MFRLVVGVVGLIILSGCVTAAPKLRTIAVSAGEAEVETHFQRRLVLEQSFLDNHRLETIRFNVGRSAVRFCPDRIQHEFGFAVANKHSFGMRERRIATRAYGFNDRLRVLHVIKDSPAYNAGLRSGDVILRVNGTPVPTGSSAEPAYRLAAERDGAARLTLVVEPAGSTSADRASGPREINLVPVRTCRFDIELTEAQKVGAYAMGGGVTITKGMLWFARGDELAFVVAHELVHVIREHRRMIGKFGVNQKDVEAEADYMGLYIMARAGYEIGTAPRFWRRIAAYFPRFGGSGRTHPSTSYRFVAMNKTVAEINAKIVAGVALVPGADATLAAATPGT